MQKHPISFCQQFKLFCTIQIMRLVKCGVNEALQALTYEMVHLYQHHFGDPGRGRYLNKEWGNKMESIGLMPSSTGRPGGRRTWG